WLSGPYELQNGFISISNLRRMYYHVPGGATCMVVSQHCWFKEIIASPVVCPIGWSGGGLDPAIGYYCYRAKKAPCKDICTQAGNPVDVFMRRKVQTESDWTLGLLRVGRTYRSDGFFEPAGAAQLPKPLGFFWRLTYERTITELSVAGVPVVMLARDNGTIMTFTDEQGGYVGDS